MLKKVKLVKKKNERKKKAYNLNGRRKPSFLGCLHPSHPSRAHRPLSNFEESMDRTMVVSYVRKGFIPLVVVQYVT
jgi:hypothetical protein